MSSSENGTFFITGSTDGIGLHTAESLQPLVTRLYCTAGARRGLIRLLSKSKRSLKPLGKVQSIDCIINNAGVFMPEFQQSAEGHEMTFAVNVFSHFLLINLLKDLLSRSPSPRLVNTSSISQSSSPPEHFQLSRSNYNPHTAYEQSKLFNRMLTVYQAKAFPAIT